MIEEDHSRPAKKSKKTKKNKDKRRSTDNSLLFNNSSVTDKEVFTSGDKIMVSVNFRNSTNKPAAEIAATKKPTMTIDVMCSPYQVLEPSPEPVVDVFSDDETNNTNNKQTSNDDNLRLDNLRLRITDNLLNIPKQTDINNKSKDNDVMEVMTNENVEHIETHKGPCTPPDLAMEMARGPQTPDDPMDSYDPCDPTGNIPRW